MRTKPWCAAWLVGLIACGGGDAPRPGDPDGGRSDGDGGPIDPDGGTGPAPDARPACTGAVCFAWLPPPPVPPPRGDGRTEYAYERCNSYGVRPGVCAEGFTCGPEETFEFSTHVFRTPVCSAAPPRRMVALDLAAAPAADAVDVALTLSLGGGAWPDGSASMLRAGTLQLVSRDAAARAWSFDVPSRGSTLALAVPVGTYDVSLTMEDNQGLFYPAGLRIGELIVNRAGGAAVDVPAARAAFALRFDGVPAGPVPASTNVTLQLTRADGGVTSRSLAAGAPTSGTMVLAPGAHDIAVQSTSPDPAFPVGGAVVARGRVIPDRGAIDLPIDVATVTTTASVTVDGRDLPASDDAGVVRFRQQNVDARVEIGAARPARARARLFAGTYDVAYDSSYARLAGVPRGVARARTGWVAAPAVALAVGTVLVSGTVRRNGARLPAGGDCDVKFIGSDGATSLELSPGTGGDYTGAVFAGTYDVALSGDGVRLPSADVPVASGWVATPSTQTWQLETHLLTLQMSHNGAAPPPSTDASARGMLYVRGQRLGRDLAVVRTPTSTSGPIQTTLLVPDGRWTAVYQHVGGAYDATPFGLFDVGTVDVAGADVTRAFDMTSILVTGTVTRAGAPLPSASTPAERGLVYVMGSSYGAGYVMPGVLPASGPATFAVRLAPGVYDLAYLCNGESCQARGLRFWTYVHQALRLQ